MLTRSIAFMAALLAGCSAGITAKDRRGVKIDCSDGQASSDDCAATDSKEPPGPDSVGDQVERPVSAAKLTSVSCVDPDLSALRSDQVLMLCDGTLARGTMTVPSECTADGQGSCVVDGTSFKAAKIANVTAGDIRSGATVAGITGTLVGAPDACQSDGEVGCITTADFPAVDKVLSLTANTSKIRDNVTIAGVSGTLGDCATNGSQNCYATGSYRAATTCAAAGSNCYLPDYILSTQPLKAIDFDTITPAVVKKGAVIAGVTGDYPSATYPLAGDDGTADLTTATFDAKIKDGATDFQWFDSEGVRHSRAGDSDIKDANIKDGVDIFGATGNLSGITAADEWNLRAGVTLGSVSGKLKTNCRNGGDTLTFGMETIKTALVTAAADTLTVTGHGYLTGDVVQIDYTTAPSGLSLGTYYYVIKIDNDKFSLATTAANALVPTPINITADGADVIVWKVGSAKSAVVDSAADTLTVTAHGYSTAQAVQVSYTTAPTGIDSSNVYFAIIVNANTIKLAGTVAFANAGTAINLTANGTGVYVFKIGSGPLNDVSTIDDFNNNGSVLTNHPWSSNDNFCGGVEAVEGDTNVWKDVTTDGVGEPSTCTATPANCAMQDKISGLTWTKSLSSSITWGKALDTCKNLNFNNQATGWRLPTQKELMDAYSHGIRSAASTNWITTDEMANNLYWSSTTSSNMPSYAWVMGFAGGDTGIAYGKMWPNQLVCVR